MSDLQPGTVLIPLDLALATAKPDTNGIWSDLTFSSETIEQQYSVDSVETGKKLTPNIISNQIT